MYASRDRTISKDDLNFEETFLSFLSKKGVILKIKLLTNRSPTTQSMYLIFIIQSLLKKQFST